MVGSASFDGCAEASAAVLLSATVVTCGVAVRSKNCRSVSADSALEMPKLLAVRSATAPEVLKIFLTD
jgi:hypothetical protein